MNIKDTTPNERRAIAKAMGGNTTENSLRQVAKARRGATAAMAIKIERAAASLGLDIRRESLSPACAECEFCQKCRGV